MARVTARHLTFPKKQAFLLAIETLQLVAGGRRQDVQKQVSPSTMQFLKPVEVLVVKPEVAQGRQTRHHQPHHPKVAAAAHHLHRK